MAPTCLLNNWQSIAKVLKYDFGEELPEIRRYVLEGTEVPYNVPKTPEEAIEQRDHWQERYYHLPERHYRKVVEKSQNKE